MTGQKKVCTKEYHSKKNSFFAPTLLRGVFQYFKPMFPDNIIFSLQKDIFKTLKRSNLHIDYLPHPEGIIPKNIIPFYQIKNYLKPLLRKFIKITI